MTITKERLLKIQHWRETYGADSNVMLPAEEAEELARIALASLDAEPVGYFYADKPGDWYQISDGDRVPDHRRIPLYSSPQPAQVVKLPNEFISNEGIVVQIEKVMAVLAVHGIQYKRRGNACSAAMLQAGTLTNEGTKQAGNSPVTPDGWISCSERMPDNDESKPIAIFTGKCLGQGMFVATYDDDGFFDYWEGMEIIGVTHWMPLPEPPQEVNRG
ncbi:TPA: DUF551 domain-containing protein [Salmonella enterica]|nr:DUF551 domain-containing protein [Salmonella enterica subsp. enterica serovar Johannesburg]ECV5745175.1 DUF551 domain-containing protein [Salmonella enterica subsp. enterica serovar Johannesburg]HBK1064589.1 DUF551 domain-containing protein [Salmonella enterica]